ncbi:MAG: T9SS type A sorting domain-containing protein [Cytophagales bacterium]|nr:T9SS type A sorting domain-containing protein [Cytophagales bacterium]
MKKENINKGTSEGGLMRARPWNRIFLWVVWGCFGFVLLPLQAQGPVTYLSAGNGVSVSRDDPNQAGADSKLDGTSPEKAIRIFGTVGHPTALASGRPFLLPQMLSCTAILRRTYYVILDGEKDTQVTAQMIENPSTLPAGKVVKTRGVRSSSGSVWVSGLVVGKRYTLYLVNKEADGSFSGITYLDFNGASNSRNVTVHEKTEAEGVSFLEGTEGVQFSYQALSFEAATQYNTPFTQAAISYLGRNLSSTDDDRSFSLSATETGALQGLVDNTLGLPSLPFLFLFSSETISSVPVSSTISLSLNPASPAGNLTVYFAGVIGLSHIGEYPFKLVLSTSATQSYTSYFKFVIPLPKPSVPTFTVHAQNTITIRKTQNDAHNGEAEKPVLFGFPAGLNENHKAISWTYTISLDELEVIYLGPDEDLDEDTDNITETLSEDHVLGEDLPLLAVKRVNNKAFQFLLKEELESDNHPASGYIFRLRAINRSGENIFFIQVNVLSQPTVPRILGDYTLQTLEVQRSPNQYPELKTQRRVLWILPGVEEGETVFKFTSTDANPSKHLSYKIGGNGNTHVGGNDFPDSFDISVPSKVPSERAESVFRLTTGKHVSEREIGVFTRRPLRPIDINELSITVLNDAGFSNKISFILHLANNTAPKAPFFVEAEGKTLVAATEEQSAKVLLPDEELKSPVLVKLKALDQDAAWGDLLSFIIEDGEERSGHGSFFKITQQPVLAFYKPEEDSYGNPGALGGAASLVIREDVRVRAGVYLIALRTQDKWEARSQETTLLRVSVPRDFEPPPAPAPPSEETEGTLTAPEGAPQLSAPTPTPSSLGIEAEVPDDAELFYILLPGEKDESITAAQIKNPKLLEEEPLASGQRIETGRWMISDLERDTDYVLYAVLVLPTAGLSAISTYEFRTPKNTPPNPLVELLSRSEKLLLIIEGPPQAAQTKYEAYYEAYYVLLSTDDPPPTEGAEIESHSSLLRGDLDIEFGVEYRQEIRDLDPAKSYKAYVVLKIDDIYSEIVVSEEAALLEVPEIGHSLRTQPSLHIYPNPTRGIIHLEGLDPNALSSVYLHNLLGKELPLVPEAKDSFSLAHLPKGVYLLEIKQGPSAQVFWVVLE